MVASGRWWSNLRLVVSIAKGIWAVASLLDLIQEGSLG